MGVDVDWEAVGTIVALLGVLITFVFNILSNRTTRHGQEEQRAFAQAAAARAEEATRVSHGYTERVVDAWNGLLPAACLVELFPQGSDGNLSITMATPTE